jgi:hypothetical protein
MNYVISVILRQLDLPYHPGRRLRFQLGSARLIYARSDLFIIGQLLRCPLLCTLPLLRLAHPLLPLQPLVAAVLGLYLKTLIPGMCGQASRRCLS